MSKKIFSLLFLLVLVLIAGHAFAANCTLSGQVFNVDGTLCKNCVITFNPATQQPLTTGGTAYTSQPVSTTTDASGNLTAITLPQGLIVQVTISENGATFGGYTAIVPFMSSVTFVQMNQGISTNPLNVLASSQPPTGSLSMNNQKITNLACPTTGGDALAWNCNATVNNLTITGSTTLNTSGSAFNGLVTDTQIANPSAPSSVTAIGTTGATSYYYFVVCHDGNGGTTLASAGTNVANANATLSSSNYDQVAWTFPTHALNCDILRNTSNTTTGAQSCTNGLAVTSSPFNDQSNTTAAYTIPTRNSTGDGQFAGAFSAGTVPSGIATGDLSTAESATTGRVWYGSNGSQSIDFGVTKAGQFTLTGGPLVVGTSPTNVVTTGDVIANEGGQIGAIYFGTGGASSNHHFDFGLGTAGHFELSNFGGSTILDVGTTISAGTINVFDGGTLSLQKGGTLTLGGATSGSASITVAAVAGTPTTLVLPTANATAGQFLQNDGSGNLSWASTPHGMQLFTAGGTFTVPAGVYSFVVQCWGAGGGGGGYGAAAVNGGAGGNTTVGSVCTANGGTGGTGVAAGSTAAGGQGASTAGAVGTITLKGSSGAAGNVQISSSGGGGGAAPGSSLANSGIAGGSYGGGGPGAGDAAFTHGAGGGGSGGWSEAQVTTTPSSTFVVTIGGGGSAGTGGTGNGTAGSDGAALFIW